MNGFYNCDFFFTTPEHIIDTVKRVIKEYYNRITTLEDQKFDLEYLVKKKDFEVSDDRGVFLVSILMLIN